MCKISNTSTTISVFLIGQLFFSYKIPGLAGSTMEKLLKLLQQIFKRLDRCLLCWATNSVKALKDDAVSRVH